MGVGVRGCGAGHMYQGCLSDEGISSSSVNEKDTR